MPLEKLARQWFADAAQLNRQFIDEQTGALLAAAHLLARTLTAGHKLLLFGNGGSAADAQHLAAEFVNRFRIERPPLAALALTTDTSILTAVANDYDFSQVFVKQLKALGRPGDLAWGISTSGGSPNVLAGLQTARRLGMATLALAGRDGGAMVPLADVALIVRSNDTPRIQEVHITIGHVLCDLVDHILFPEKCAPHASA